MNAAYEIGLWAFAIAGWFVGFCVATAHNTIRDGIVERLRKRELVWYERARRPDTYEAGYADGLREAAVLVESDSEGPPRGKGPRLAAA